ncbi:MAG: MotA/TolQ/ExbB proton channel family protein [Gemmatimonadota bacterium]
MTVLQGLTAIAATLQQPALETGGAPNLWVMIQISDLMTKIILVILLFFSILSWAIILRKFRAFRRLRQQRQQFFHVFERREGLADAYQATLSLPDNSFSEVFKAGVRELRHLTQGPERPAAQAASLADFDERGTATATVPKAAAVSLLEKELIAMTLEREAARQVEEYERHLPFLATTGSVSPFFGLLGTVWGIMDAFVNLGVRGGGNINVVAPGVAAALVATAAGLAVAIPAVIAYNYFLSEVKVLNDDMRNFSTELVNVIVRDYRLR